MNDNDQPEASRRDPAAGDPALSSIELQKEAFLTLSSELIRILSDLTRKVADASERLRETELEVERKTGEFETLERLRAEQNRLRESEQLEARRRFEEELQSLRQKGMERHEALERDFERREETLADREREAARLLEELEMLLGRIALRSRTPAVPPQGPLRVNRESRGPVPIISSIPS